MLFLQGSAETDQDVIICTVSPPCLKIFSNFYAFRILSNQNLPSTADFQ